VNIRDVQTEANIPPHIPESVFTLLGFVDDPVPPRDPNNGDDEEEDEDEEDNEGDDREPAVIRELDEDE
jgi:hypothetical protein